MRAIQTTCKSTLEVALREHPYYIRVSIQCRNNSLLRRSLKCLELAVLCSFWSKPTEECSILSADINLKSVHAAAHQLYCRFLITGEIICQNCAGMTICTCTLELPTNNGASFVHQERHNLSLKLLYCRAMQGGSALCKYLNSQVHGSHFW